MITLYAGGSHFGLPDPSPFVTKAEMLLRFAKIPFTVEKASFGKAPKGKIPYIADEGILIGDLTLIRLHLEKRYGARFDANYAEAKLANAWMVEKMLEEHLYWLMVYERWAIDANFRKGPALFFNAAPAPIRPFVRMLVKRQVRKNLWAQGLARHTEAERFELGRRDLDAVAVFSSGTSPTFWAKSPAGGDATLFGIPARGHVPAV